ncbi:phenylalanine--tRNA ligase subunit alpha [Candidatus Saccharibacteria bacterium]|nr:phenylalanine--tRNA ligase subunit alpha [Candidatus Saccharibacteria bacterium]
MRYNILYMVEIEKLKQELKDLNAKAAGIRDLPVEQRAEFGRKINLERQDLLGKIAAAEKALLDVEVQPIDVTAWSGVNEKMPEFYTTEMGTCHPLMAEMDRVVEIYQLMGFDVMESRQLDDEYHMFDTLNFPKEHPARDGYDTFRTEEGLIPPAHTSTMQHRVLKKYRKQLEERGRLAVVVPGRVFRNEDVDATHEHTFYQCEGVYVSQDCSMGQMLGILREFFEKYYEQKLNIRTQPGYFPFTEPSLEFMIEKPESLGGKKGDYLEMLGCGMIHPNVLKQAGIDPEKYHGFAWGGGIDRLVMLRYGLNDVRMFESGNLNFLREF